MEDVEASHGMDERVHKGLEVEPARHRKTRYANHGLMVSQETCRHAKEMERLPRKKDCWRENDGCWGLGAPKASWEE